MAKRKLFDKLNQYNANDVKDPRAQEKYSKLLNNFDDFSKLDPKYMQNLVDGVKNNAAPGWITSVDYKHKEIDDLVPQVIEEARVQNPSKPNPPTKPPKPKNPPTKPPKPKNPPAKPPKPKNLPAKPPKPSQTQDIKPVLKVIDN